MKRKTIRKYLSEGFLIIFSVLLALFLNKLFENYKINKQAEIARQSIVRELKQNALIAQSLQQRHSGILKRVAGLRSGEYDSLKQELLKNDFLNIPILTDNQTIIDDLLLSTAWETARSTGIISEFSYTEVEALTRVYALQNIVLNQTLYHIIDMIFQPDTHEMKNIDKTLLQFELRFRELAGQENLLNELFKEALAKVDK
jgi:hypothetical protein